MLVANFSEPANYPILVKGIFSQEGLSIFESVRIKIQNDSPKEESLIDIYVKDQAHLTAIFNYLFENKYVIINVEMKGLISKIKL